LYSSRDIDIKRYKSHPLTARDALTLCSANRAHDQHANHRSFRMLAASSAANPSTVQDLSGVSILVLDDDANMRSLIRGALARCHCENILLSSQARDALQLFSSRTIDLVILDWMMTPMSGLEFLRELRRPERRIKVPVIVLSASSDPRDMALARQFSISGWLTKPITLPELIRQISAVLTLSAVSPSLDQDLAEEVERLTERYRSKLADDLRLLDEALAGMKHVEDSDGSGWAAAAERKPTWALVDRIMHNIKGQAGSFNFGLVTSVAMLGQEMTRPLAGSTNLVFRHHDGAHRCVAALVQAMRLVLQNEIRGDGGQIGARLLEKLRSHTEQIRSRLVSDTAPA
jgi:two-component system chemotaxis response regulator CheY